MCLRSLIKVSLFCCIATNLTHFLPSIASILETNPMTHISFTKIFFFTHRRRRNRENKKKTPWSIFNLNLKNGNFKIGKIPLLSFFLFFIFYFLQFRTYIPVLLLNIFFFCIKKVWSPD